MHKRLLLIIASLLAYNISIAEGSSYFLIKAGYAVGNKYNAFIDTLSFKNLKGLNLGIDIYQYNYVESNVNSSSYLGIVYISSSLMRREKVNIDWIFGLTSSYAKYQIYATDTVTTIGFGAEMEYKMSNNTALGGKVIAVMYSNGFSIPFYIGPEFNLKRFSLSLYLEGLVSIITGGKTSTSADSGLMAAIGFKF